MRMSKKSVYMVGIKGVAMTALAIYFSEKGYAVSGSDTTQVFSTDEALAQHKIPVFTGFHKENIKKQYDLVVVTGAHGGMTNQEAVESKSRGITTLMHGQVLGELMDSYEGISVCGCHGKTTTSSMIASLLKHAGRDASYAIGVSHINDLGLGGHFGKGAYFVAEADEYVTCPITDKTPRFLWQHPSIIALTNIDYDHPDVYQSIEEVKEAYLTFMGNLTLDGTIVACIDDIHIQQILPHVDRQIVTYGFSKRADFVIEKCTFRDTISFMRIRQGNIEIGEFMLHVSGKHNLLNALGAFLVARTIGISWKEIQEFCKLFRGTKRRMEKIGEAGNITVYDDYAHHPDEIYTTIEGIKHWLTHPRVIVIFQPHTYSRTRALRERFATSFIKADHVIVVDIYASAREIKPPRKSNTYIDSHMLVDEINKQRKNALYISNKREAIEYVSSIVKKNDVIVTMGAGDIFTWGEEILASLKDRIV